MISGGRCVRHGRPVSYGPERTIGPDVRLACCLLLIATPAVAQAPPPLPAAADFAAAAVPPPDCAAAVAPDRALTLPELVDVALCRSPATRAGWAGVRSAEARRRQALAGYGPRLDASLGPDVGVSRRWGGGFPAGTDSSASATASLSVGWLLFDFGGREARLDSADAGLAAALSGFADQAQAVVLETALATSVLFAADASLAAAIANRDFARASLDAATARERAGIAIRSDVLQADAALAQAELTLRQAQGQQLVARGRLATALVLPPQTVVRLAAPPPLSGPADLDRSAEALIAEADRLRPDLGLAAANARAAAAGVRLAQSARRPSVSLGAGPALSVGTVGQDVASASVGVTLSIPLFDSGGRTAAVAEAQAEADRAVAQYEGQRQSAAFAVWSSYQAFATEAANLGTARRLLSSATEAARLAQGRYRAGLATVTELLDAQARLVSARQELVGAEFGVRRAELELAGAVGRIGDAVR